MDRVFLVLTGACQFGHGVGGFTTNFIHSEPSGKPGWASSECPMASAVRGVCECERALAARVAGCSCWPGSRRRGRRRGRGPSGHHPLSSVSVVVCCHLGAEWVAGAPGHMRRRLVRSNLPALFRFAPRRPSAAHDQSIPGRRCASFEFTRCARRTRAARATTARGRCIPRARPRSAASRARGGHTSSGQDTTSLSALLLRHRTLTKGERTVERGEQHQNTNPILVRPTPTHAPSRP